MMWYRIELVDLRILIVRPDGSTVFEFPASEENFAEAQEILARLNHHEVAA